MESLTEVEIAELHEESELVRSRAYSRFSGFRVGAVVRSKCGKIFTGCNVENSSYGLSICAERVAICKAVSEGVREFDLIYINCGRENGFSSPCGACRQFIAEFAPMRVVCCDGNGYVVFNDPSELLPRSFKL